MQCDYSNVFLCDALAPNTGGRYKHLIAKSLLWTQELRNHTITNSSANVGLIDYQFLYLADSLVAHTVNRTDLSKQSSGLNMGTKGSKQHFEALPGASASVAWDGEGRGTQEKVTDSIEKRSS